MGVVVPNSLGLVSVQSWCDSANGVAYLFGGLVGRHAMDGFWKFSFETLTFERIDIQLPPRRYGGMTWMTSRGEFWLFSGEGVDSADMWVYDLFKNEWEIASDGGKESSGVYGTLNVASADNHPGCRQGGFTFVGPCGNLWLYGGTGYGASFRFGRGLLNDLWMFDVQNRTWTWMGGPQVNEGTGRLGANPWCSPRAEGATWRSVGNTTWIFGGFGHDVRGDDAIMNDLWRLEIVGACGEKNDSVTSPSPTVATGDRVDETTTVPSTSRSPTVAMMPTGNDSVVERTTAPSTSPVVDNDESASAFMEHTAESSGGNDSATKSTPTVGKDNATTGYSEYSIEGTGASSENATSPPPPNDSSVETTSVKSFVTSTNDDVSVGIETTSSTASVAITKSSISLKPSTSESTKYNATSAAATTTISETTSQSPFSTNEAKEIATVSLGATEPETIISTGAPVTTVTAKPSTKTTNGNNGNATAFSPSAVATTTKVSSKSPTLFPGSGTPSQRSTEPGTIAENHAEAVITNSARRPTVKTNRSSASTNPPASIFVKTRRPTPSVWISTVPTSVRTRRPTAAPYSNSTVIPSKTRVVASTRVGDIAATSAAPSTRSSKSSELTSGPNRAEFASGPQLPDETQFEFPVRHPYPTPPQRVDAWLGSSASVPYIAICVAAFSVLLLVIAAFCGRKRRGRAKGGAVGARANRDAGRFRYQKVASEEGTEW